MEIFKNLDLPLKERQLAFLEDIVSHYTSENRAERPNLGGCVYNPAKISTHKTEGCAIGRHLLFDKYPELADIEASRDDTSIDEMMMYPDFLKLMPEWLEKLNEGDKYLTFLSRCQRLHDQQFNWDENGLTKEGRNEVELIKIQFNLI